MNLHVQKSYADHCRFEPDIFLLMDENKTIRLLLLLRLLLLRTMSITFSWNLWSPHTADMNLLIQFPAPGVHFTNLNHSDSSMDK